eukprot:TRINITY_DN4538_c0_g2_i1.p1 TRINITY_DN4538_c0_g2~~TRINITY_DN4538_c0_g2_i1.p1  ORF type:complete len:160 (-),score=21.13 TRINITY_DN4538_c0_g2_i1:50-529(-)
MDEVPQQQSTKRKAKVRSDVILKIVVIGSAGSGKTCLVRRFGLFLCLLVFTLIPSIRFAFVHDRFCDYLSEYGANNHKNQHSLDSDDNPACVLIRVIALFYASIMYFIDGHPFSRFLSNFHFASFSFLFLNHHKHNIDNKSDMQKSNKSDAYTHRDWYA